MPEACHRHVLDGAGLAVGKFDANFCLLRYIVGPFLGPGDSLALSCRKRPLGRTVNRFAIPLRIAEMVVRFYEVVDREVILAVVESRAAADNLFELDHRVDWAHQHDVTDVARIHAGGKLLRGGQDGWDSLLVILKIPQVLFAESAVVSRYTLAVVRVGLGLQLVDEVA